jgi:hypothetical protein
MFTWTSNRFQRNSATSVILRRLLKNDRNKKIICVSGIGIGNWSFG